MSDIYLCVTEPESGRFAVKAVYDEWVAAEAWKEGVEAGYTSGHILKVSSAQGALDIGELVKAKQEADHA